VLTLPRWTEVEASTQPPTMTACVRWNRLFQEKLTAYFLEPYRVLRRAEGGEIDKVEHTTSSSRYFRRPQQVQATHKPGPNEEP
jgi:hypothetical protein